MTKRIVVFGATGATGSHLIKQALNAGLTVRAFVRSPDKLPADVRKNPMLEVFQGDLTDMAAIDKAIEGSDFVVSTAGDAKASKGKMMTAFVTQAVQSMRKYGVKRLVYQAGAFSPMPGQTLPLMLRMMRPTIGAMLGMTPMLDDNDAVMAYLVGNASDLDWTVTRPGMIREAASKGTLKGSTTPGPAVTFADLAAFNLATAQSNTFVHESPYPAY